MPKPHNPFSIRAAAGRDDATEVFIYGEIGESWYDETVAARTFVQELAAIDSDVIIARINSPGGSVTDGMAIYNALRRHPATVHVEIDGLAASAASMIAMAGDTVSMASNALLMIHAPWGGAWGNARDLRQFADVLDKHAEAMAQAYASGTGKPADEFLEMLTDGEDHWFTAQEAADAGYIHKIGAELPIAAQIASMFDLSRFKRYAPAAAAAKSGKKEEPAMPDPVNPSAAVPTEEEIRAKVEREEKARRQAIEAKFAMFQGREDLNDLKAECLADMKVTPEQAGEKILAKLAEGSEPVQGRVTVVEDERDVKRAAAVEAIMARAGVPGVKADRNNPYRGYRLLDLARESVEASGMSTKGMDQLKIVGSAFTQSTSDFPVLLEEAMHKTLQTAYAAASDTWSRFCATGSVSDFRAHNRYRVGSLGNLDKLNELGEFRNKAIPDGEKASVQAGTVGNIINLSRQAIINDDLGAFIGLSQMLGRAAARTIEATVYALLAENSGQGPKMEDGKTLFHASHGNVATGAALSVEAIDAMRVLMASQKDISGNDFLDIRPYALLVPLGMGGDARVINDAEYDPDTSSKLQKPNKVRGLFGDIIDTPRLTGTRYYAFAAPDEAPVIEVSFLDGNQTPYLEVMDGFDVDGARYKVRLDFGVSAVDYRGAVTNAGQ